MQEIGICGIIRGVTQRNAANLLRLSPPPKRIYIYKIANLSGLARSVETSKFHCLNEHGEIRKLKAELNSIRS